MCSTSVVKRVFWGLVVLSAGAVPLQAGFIIPSSEWGSGSGNVYDNIANYHGPFSCTLSSSVNTCTESISSNLPATYPFNPDGTASGTVSASTDANGAHVYVETGVSGYANTTVTGGASIYDTVYNHTAAAAEFQLTFHLDATLYSRSSSAADLDVGFNNQSIFQANVSYGGAGTYDFVDQTFTTPLELVAANSYFNWSLVLNTTATASSMAGAQYLAGLPTSYVDAGNTLSLTGIGIFDAQGNPLTASGLTSYAGFDYSASSTSVTAAPEPATVELFGLAGVAFVLVGRIKINPLRRKSQRA